MITPTGVSVSAYNAAVKADAPSHIRMTFTDQNIVFEDADFVQGGVTITSILNGDTDLTIGSAVMSQVTAEMFVTDKTKQLLWDKEFKLEIGIEVNGSTVWVTIGYFAGERPEKLNSEGVVLFTANDRMGKFDILADDWLNSIDYTTPQTVQDLFDSLCSYVGVTNTTGDELSNIMSRSYSASPFASGGILCRDVLALIAEAAGCYAKVTNEGKVKLVWFADHTDYELTGDDEFKIESLDINFSDGSMTWEEMEVYTWEDLEQMRWSDIEHYQQQLAINALNVVQTVEDVGVIVPTVVTGNVYMIVDNPFLTTASDADVTAYITPIYNRLHALGGYLPLSMECIGNPCVEAGDIITVDVKGESVALPIFYKTMTCNGTCTDNYEATGNVKREEVPMNQREKLSTGGRYHVFKNTVDELYSELYDPATGDVSVLQQTASALGMTAAGIDITGGKYVRIRSGGTFDVESTNFELSSSDDYMLIRTDDGIFEISSVDHIGNTNGTRINPGSCFDVYIKYPRFGSWQTYLFQFKYFGKADYIWESSHLSGATDNIACFDGVRQVGTVDKPVAYYLGQSIFGSSIIPWNNQAFQEGSDFLTVAASPYGKLGNSNHLWLDAYISEVHYYYLTTLSSRDVKHDIKPLPSVGEKLDKLKPVTFVYNNDQKEKQRMGLIYEDTVDEVPEICLNNGENKSINYVDLIPMLLKEIQDLRKRVAELERRVK